LRLTKKAKAPSSQIAERTIIARRTLPIGIDYQGLKAEETKSIYLREPVAQFVKAEQTTSMNLACSKVTLSSSRSAWRIPSASDV
jgi:hypothetical protein